MNRDRDGQAQHPCSAVGRPRSHVRMGLLLPLLAALAAPVIASTPPATSKPGGAAKAPVTAKPAGPSQSPARPPAASGVAATVGPLSISSAELEQRTAQALADYRSRSSTEIPAELRPTVKREMLERLIQRQLLTLEAKRSGIAVSESEAEEVVRNDPFFVEGGVFNQAKYLAVKNGNPAQFAAAIEQAKLAVAVRKLTERVTAGQHLDERAIQAKAMRGLERASFDYLALRRNSFDGTYPEPRESEIVAYYRDHASDLRRPDRAVLSILSVQQELEDSTLRTPERLAAWEQGLRKRADSVLKVVQGGARLEVVAQSFGGLHTKVVALPGNFPAYWRGDDRVSASVFKTAPGSMLTAPVPSNPGWLVVRVDELTPAHTARLEEAAPDIRAQLRLDRRQHAEERQLTALYRARLDSLKGTGYRVRYAVIDTAAVDPGEPATADLDRYYRGHLADYSTFNNQTGSVESKPFASVRDEVRGRWLAERRMELARAQAERIHELWSQGKRDEKLERAPGVRVREAGPVPLGAPVDSGAAAQVVTDSLSARGGALGVGLSRYPAGVIVFDVHGRVPGYTPTFEQARPTLVAWRDREQAQRDEQGARALYDRDPVAFAIGKTLHWSSVIVELPDVLTMKMTHREVEEYQRLHLERYSAPEVVHASHILVTPTDSSPEADRRARARADSLLALLRAGANFAQLARQASDDEATRDEGGDLGEFGRGTMLREFERVAFGLAPGEMSGVVKTEVGYHIIRCHEHLPPVVQPLVLMYSNVSADLAAEKSEQVAARRADSLLRVLRTPAQARAAAAKLHLKVQAYSHPIGQQAGRDPQLRAYFEKLDTLRPGQLYPGTYAEKGLGYMVSWVDSVTAPVAPVWDQARSTAIDRYRHGAADRALQAKRAEMDSMMAAGWSFDSLATLWGGLEHAVDANLATRLPYLGARDLDTLVFGTRVPARLKIGEVSDWVGFPAGLARLRVIERPEPNAAQLAARVESERQMARARVMESYFSTLKKRYPVRIIDPEMSAVILPPIPEDASP